MKPVFLASALLLLSMGLLFAQKKDIKGYLSISPGLSIPISDFSKKEISNRFAGLANTGLAADISYSRLLGKTFGIAASLQGQINPLAKTQIENSFSGLPISSGGYFGSGGTNTPPPAPAGTIYPGWHFEKKSWKLASLLAGAYTEFPLSQQKIVFTAKAMLGASRVQLPALKGSSISDTASATVDQTGAVTTSLCYSTAAGMRWSAGGRFYVMACLQYFQTKAKFDQVTATVTSTKGTAFSPNYIISQSKITATASQDIRSVNIYAGIGFSLGRAKRK